MNHNSIKKLIIYACTFILLLILRDTFSIGINKFIFLILYILFSFTSSREENIIFGSFLMPLLVGLPNNYIYLVMLLRLFYFKRISKKIAVCIGLAILVSIILTMEAIVHNNLNLDIIIYVIDLLILVFYFDFKADRNILQLIVFFYCLGVACTGSIMVISTLRVHSINDLLFGASRLGMYQMSYAEKGVMRVYLDPNYLGLFTISAITIGVNHLFYDNDKKYRIGIIVSLFVSLLCALLGLSRSFFIVLVIYAIFFLLLNGKVRASFLIVIVSFLTLFVVYRFMPGVVTALNRRFSGDNLMTGNGRLYLIEMFYNDWKESIITILFGVDLQKCNVHCMPLQLLFGGGILYFLAFVIYFVNIMKDSNRLNTILKLRFILPFIATLLMCCTVPSAIGFVIQFPVFIAGYYFKSMKALSVHTLN